MVASAFAVGIYFPGGISTEADKWYSRGEIPSPRNDSRKRCGSPSMEIRGSSPSRGTMPRPDQCWREAESRRFLSGTRSGCNFARNARLDVLTGQECFASYRNAPHIPRAAAYTERKTGHLPVLQEYSGIEPAPFPEREMK